MRKAIVASVCASAVVVAAVAVWHNGLEQQRLSAISAIGGANVTWLLRPGDLGANQADPEAGYGVTSNRVAVFKAGPQLWVVTSSPEGSPRLDPVAHLGDEVPSSLALDVTGTMLTVSGRYLGMLDADGRPLHSVPLPYDGARLQPSVHQGAVYLISGAAGDQRLYRFIEDGTLQVVLETNEPIVAAADSADAIYGMTPTKIVRVRAGPAQVVFQTPKRDWDGPLMSLAVTQDGVVLFSTATRVYALLGRNAVSIVNNAGGYLLTRDEALYVFDARRQILFALSPASADLFKD
jgi:hypothetical protein